MGSFFKEYFTFSRGERNGILVLLFIIISLIALPSLIGLFRQQKEINFFRFQNDIAQFERHQELARLKKTGHDTTAAELFVFDPNDITEADWRRLGVGEKTTRSIINYRNKGGYFDEKQDLLKIYGFDSAKYKMLEPYIVFSETNKEKEIIDPFDKPVFKKPAEKKIYRKENSSYDRKTEFKPKEKAVVELNSADTAELAKLRGIGSILSGRIVKYRDRLGGFMHVDQLREVYGMDSARFQIIKSSLVVDSTQIVKILINTVSCDELEKHPYFGRSAAKAIVSYRQQHGRFQHADDLGKIYAIDKTLLEKMKPYVTID